MSLFCQFIILLSSAFLMILLLLFMCTMPLLGMLCHFLPLSFFSLCHDSVFHASMFHVYHITVLCVFMTCFTYHVTIYRGCWCYHFQWILRITIMFLLLWGVGFFFLCVCVTGVSVCMLGTWTHSLCIGHFPIKLYCSVNVIIPVAYHIIVLFAFVTLYL